MDSTETPVAQQSSDVQADIAQNKDLAAFSYVWIMSIVVFALRRNSPFVRRHSRQGIVLFLLSIPLWFVPWIGHFLVLIFIVPMMIFGFIKALQGEEVRLPLIASLLDGTCSWKETWKHICIVWSSLRALVQELTQRWRKKKQGPSLDNHELHL